MGRMRTLLILAPLLAACGSGGGREAPTAHRSPRDQQRYEAAVQRGEILLGMTRGEVTRAWGKPRRRARETYRGRKNIEVWLYAFAQVHFDADGYVMGFRSAAG